jgi:hypothetical protein
MKINILKLTTLTLAAVAILNFSSCNKSEITDEFSDLVNTQESDLTFEESSYEISTENLSNTDNSTYYTEGVITYSKNGTELAKVDFGNGAKDEDYSIKKDGVKKDYKLKKADKYNFEKVIVQPIVKTTDCDYPTSGIIDFFKEGEWVATINFGDGTCDEFATKTSAKGVETFNMNESK